MDIKKALFLIVLNMNSLFLYAQDIMVRRNEEEARVNMLDESPSDVRYKYKRIGNTGSSVNTPKVTPKYYNALEEWKKYTIEISQYFQDGWGVGFQLRKEPNRYFGVNFVGVTYKSGFFCPAKAGQINFSPVGVRLSFPVNKRMRIFTEWNVGYTYIYVSGQELLIPGYRSIKINGSSYSYMGVYFSAGIQLSRHVAVGYNLDYLNSLRVEEKKIYAHWGKVSFLF